MRALLLGVDIRDPRSVEAPLQSVVEVLMPTALDELSLLWILEQ